MRFAFPLSLLLHLIVLIICFLSCVQPLCLSHERLALLQLKDSFTIDKDASSEYSPSYPKVASWTTEGNHSDCCSWDGVECDGVTGHVISLDLTSSWLHGAIDSNSSLFKLSQLESLSLADNSFNYSQIPSRLGNLSRLVYLDLSYSDFEGKIPSEISQLSKLAYLDLTYAYTNSTFPHFLANMSSLVTLLLEHCAFRGEFPNSVFQLPNLQNLDLGLNANLFGGLPEFHSGSRLKRLSLRYTGFSGTIRSSIGNLDFLIKLQLAACRFSGLLPSSLGKLTRLAYLDLSYNNFAGQVPSFLQNLTQLTELELDSNQFSGQIPAWLANLTHLTRLSLRNNTFHGPVPPSFSGLVNLEDLLLSKNELSGTQEIDMFLDLKYLKILHLSGNNISLLTETNNPNATISKFNVLLLRSCNLSNFPSFLRYQEKLEVVDLSENRIFGQIPKWLLNTSTKSLLDMDISRNSLTGFDQRSPSLLPWIRLVVLSLSQNKLKGSVPIPPPSIVKYDVSKNELSGEISSWLCTTSSLQFLDLSSNKLTGTLPKCLEKFSNSLTILNIGNNSFHGTIPQIGANGSILRAIDFNQNQLEGILPRSLANCTRLEVLNLGNNKLNDVFPSWLGCLRELRLLLLRQNRFHGVLKAPISNFVFQSLRVIDLSYNNFSGQLPSEYLQKWNSMKRVEVSNSSYLEGEFYYDHSGLRFFDRYLYSMSIANKGVVREYGKIQEVFVVIDFSSNRFEGEIPECVGSLQGIQVLNLSNNILRGSIPSSLGNITRLESLDLSQNKLAGEIPQQLAQLTFLAFLNVSHNHLMGPIPKGNQFDTFENSSYIGNSRLCGYPLSNKCGNLDQPPITPPLSFEEKESSSVFEFNWMTIFFGYLGGLVVGISIEHVVAAEYGWSRAAFFLRKVKERFF